MLDVTSEPGSDSRRETFRDDLDVLRDPAWFLHRLDTERDAAIFIKTSRRALSDAAFLDPSWDRGQTPRRVVPLSLLKSFQGERPAPAVLWHSAFCCSTLIAGCLDAAGICLALREPAALPDLDTAWRRCDADEETVAAVLGLLGRGFTPDERVAIKPSNGANALLSPVASAGGQHVLIYSSCRDFLLAVAGGGPSAGGGEDRRRLVRALLGERITVGRPGFRWRPEELFAATDLQAAALLWHAQMAEFRAVTRAQGRRRVRSLDCEVFLAEPRRTLEALDSFLEFGLGAARIETAASGPKLSRYAKQPNRAFGAEQRREGLEAVAAELGEHLDQVVAWSYRVCPETPPGDPVGAPLLTLHA
jgi:hypothetical protein